MASFIAPLFTHSQNRKERHPLSGFTLTEVTIVLGVIGIIIAGVFAAAAAARYRVEVNQASDEINEIVGNMHSLYAGRSAAAAPVVAFGAFTLIQQGVFPPEMLSVPLPKSGIPAANTVVNHIWNQNYSGGSVQIRVNDPSAPSQFTIRFYQVPSDVCADLLVHNSLPGPETGLQQIQVNSNAIGVAGKTNQPLPITPLVAATACPTGATYTIDWYYTLGS